jgi:hypothetical protein
MTAAIFSTVSTRHLTAARAARRRGVGGRWRADGGRGAGARCIGRDAGGGAGRGRRRTGRGRRERDGPHVGERDGPRTPERRDTPGEGGHHQHRRNPAGYRWPAATDELAAVVTSDAIVADHR